MTGFYRTRASSGKRSSRRKHPIEAPEWRVRTPRTRASVVVTSQPIVLNRTSRDLDNPTSDCVTVTLGDYIDRGPDSRGVLDRLVRNPFPTALVALKGNHEAPLEMFSN